MPDRPIPPIALVLAAGFSRRFGSDKRTALLPDGTRVLETVIARIEDAGLAVLPVLRVSDFERWPLFTTALPVEDEVAQLGLGNSLAAATAIVPAGRSVMVCLGDMPFIATATYAALAAVAEPAKIICPVYRGQRGNPVLFGAHFVGELKTLAGDRGARLLLEKHAAHVVEIDVNDPGIHRDIDRPEDLNGA
jgi:molybdenum cofactor cytidylyltransferase